MDLELPPVELLARVAALVDELAPWNRADDLRSLAVADLLVRRDDVVRG